MKTIISIFTIIFLFISIPLWAIDLQNASLKELVGTVTVSVVKDVKGRGG